MARRKKLSLRTLISVAIFICILFAAIFVLDAVNVIDKDAIFAEIFGNEVPDGEKDSQTDEVPDGEKDSLTGKVPVTAGNLNVHFIDVGQADCALFMTDGANMLIDTGDLSDTYTDKIIKYLKDQGVEKLDYLVLTHPDSDHIGGAPEIINEFEVVNCIMPDFTKDTKIFENTIDALDKNNVNVIEGKPGYSFEFGDTLCNVLAPIGEPEDSNNASVVIKLTHGDNVFMLTGDAEFESEERMLEQYAASDLDADFLKAGHHGSSTSSTEEFLDAVTPEYALISSGTGNKYGHPHVETIEKYEERNIEYYRTDINGTVVVVSDGKELTITTEKN